MTKHSVTIKFGEKNGDNKKFLKNERKNCDQSFLCENQL